MVDKKNITLTKEDKKIIDALKVAPVLKIINIGRKSKVEDILSIEDLSNKELEELLPKIDLYINELYDLRLGFDEMWVIEYSVLKDRINERLITLKTNIIID